MQIIQFRDFFSTELQTLNHSLLSWGKLEGNKYIMSSQCQSVCKGVWCSFSIFTLTFLEERVLHKQKLWGSECLHDYRKNIKKKQTKELAVGLQVPNFKTQNPRQRAT